MYERLHMIKNMFTYEVKEESKQENTLGRNDQVLKRKT